ncbi:MAG: hypothetical protein IJU37_10735 [Desulfovibrio sp.]|nr:hypothetical protein [Desulfovibrio sp.]
MGGVLGIHNRYVYPTINEFTIEDVYTYESYLSNLHPGNKNVKEKIRQQLQILRDKDFIEFTARGKYRKLKIKVL